MYVSFYSNLDTGSVKTKFSSVKGSELLHGVEHRMTAPPELQIIEVQTPVEGFSDKDARLAVAKTLWQSFSDVPVCDSHDDGLLEESFLHFTSGTSAYTVWHWFESEFNLSIGQDLL